MKDLFNKGKRALESTIAPQKLLSQFESGMGVIKNVVNGLPIVISFERANHSEQLFDEKHYFVIPYYLSDTGFSLHTMRSLPPEIPEINDLPKRRIFHLPSMHYEAALREYISASAKAAAYETNAEKTSSLENLANDIDALDTKLTYGMLIVGGLAALVNPIVGAGIAAKAVLPSVSGLLVKYGLRPIGEKMTRAHIEKQAKDSEKRILKQFSESSTLKVENPILQELAFALRTDATQHDPLTDPNISSNPIPELDNDDWRILTEKAITYLYRDVVEDTTKHAQARLGPEDIRWLKTLFTQPR